MISERFKIWGGRAVRWGILGGITIFLTFPFVWMLITAFKQTSDLYNLKHNPFLFYQPPTLEHVHRLFTDTLYGQWLLNTAFVGVLVVFITLVLAVPAGYALTRLTEKWGEKLGIGIFLTYLVPPTLLFIPLSRVVVNLHLDDSLWSLVVVYPSFTVPFSTWLMMGFFKAIPKDVEEAAMIDGYSRFGAFIRVVVPISLSGILTVAIFSFTLVMQEFVYAVTFISSVRNMTVSVGVPTFLVHGDVYFWGSLMAGCFIASVPIAILYNFVVDRFIAGFTVGAIK
jgi:multiple sugar transport system permease protein